MSFFDMVKLDWMYDDWPVGTILAILLVILFAMIVIAIIYGSFVAVDSCFLHKKQGEGVVIAKSHDTDGGRSTVIPVHMGIMTSLVLLSDELDEWLLSIRVGEHGLSSVGVSEDVFTSTSVGDEVVVLYSLGRFSKSLYVKEVLTKH